MGIIGERPESGVRVTLTKEADTDAYRGEATTATERHPVQVAIGEEDAVDVTITGPGATDEALTERVRLIVRTAVRHARADGRPLPRSIQRWRP